MPNPTVSMLEVPTPMKTRSKKRPHWECDAESGASSIEGNTIWPKYNYRNSIEPSADDTVGDLLVEMKGDVEVWKRFERRLSGLPCKTSRDTPGNPRNKVVRIIRNQLKSTQESIEKVKAIFQRQDSVSSEACFNLPTTTPITPQHSHHLTSCSSSGSTHILDSDHMINSRPVKRVRYSTPNDQLEHAGDIAQQTNHHTSSPEEFVQSKNETQLKPTSSSGISRVFGYVSRFFKGRKRSLTQRPKDMISFQSSIDNAQQEPVQPLCQNVSETDNLLTEQEELSSFCSEKGMMIHQNDIKKPSLLHQRNVTDPENQHNEHTNDQENNTEDGSSSECSSLCYQNNNVFNKENMTTSEINNSLVLNNANDSEDEEQLINDIIHTKNIKNEPMLPVDIEDNKLQANISPINNHQVRCRSSTPVCKTRISFQSDKDSRPYTVTESQLNNQQDNGDSEVIPGCYNNTSRSHILVIIDDDDDD